MNPLRQRTLQRNKVSLLVALALSGLALSACGDDDDGAAGPVGVIPSGDFAVARNDGSNPGSVQFYSPDIQTASGSLNTGANEGVAFDQSGNLYQNGDAASFTGLRAFDKVSTATTNRVFNNATDRQIGTSKGKGLTVVSAGSLLVSCDVTDEAADLKIYATTAGNGAAPIATVDTPAPVWDVFYDATNDRLYGAQTNGVLAVFDNFSTQVGSGPSRSITPVDAAGAKVSVNFHGVSVEGTTVVVSDVGDAASATDGALFTFADDGSVNGNLTAYTRIAGASTALGNPVDVILRNGNAIAAEKSNDALLVFNSIAGRMGDIAPDYRVDFAKPEAIEVVVDSSALVDPSDIDVATPLNSIAVALNPTPQQSAGNDSVGRINLLGADLAAVASFNAGQVSGGTGSQSFRTLENVQFDSQGNGYVVYDITDGTAVTSRGIMAIHQLASRGGQAADVPDKDRLVSDVALGLDSPKGIEIVQSRSRMIVADVGGTGSLQVYAMTAGENATPVFTVTNVGAGSIWDIDYDPVNDRLYAAGTAGDILVYDQFFGLGAGAVPTRTIKPSSAGTPSNLHGIVHVAATDQIIATDVGDAAVATDGKLYVIDNASTASGVVTPRTTIEGGATLLGNPVDIAFDGSSVYIAEKSNDKLLRYDNILGLAATIGTAADQAVDQVKPESVSLLPR